MLLQPLETLPEQLDQALTPFQLPRFVTDQILSDLELDMRQPSLLTMNRGRVVFGGGHEIRLVVAHYQVVVTAQQVEQYVGQTRVVLMENADVPGTVYP